MKNKNYFELLDLPISYDLDTKRLNDNYLLKQQIYHPDNYQDDHLSILINKAYNTLKDDYLRSIYLLELKKIENTTGHISQESLINIWEDLEILEEADDLNELKQLYKANIDRRIILLSSLNVAFKSNKLQEALAITSQLKYLINLINNIEIKIKDANRRNRRAK